MVVGISQRQQPQKRFSGRFRDMAIILSCFAGFCGLVLKFSSKVSDDAVKPAMLEQPVRTERLPQVIPTFLKKPALGYGKLYDEIKKGESLIGALGRLGIRLHNPELMLKALGQKTNLRALPVGTVIAVESQNQNSAKLDSLETKLPWGQALVSSLEIFLKDENQIAYGLKAILRPGGRVEVEEIRATTFKEHALIGGQVNNSLYRSILSGGGDAALVNNFSDIFAWQVDFFRNSHDGDLFQMVVEKNVADGRVAGFGKVLAAEYQSGQNTHRAYYFESSDKSVSGFFDEQGRSLRNAFLKSPIKLASITSKFGMRFHPVQKRMKPHNGVDYPASRGTPVMAVAGGLVINAGYSRFNGNWVRIRHMNGYETEYLHFTKLAKGIRVGARVAQSQIVGFVGMTGLATGYHLHYGMKKNGTYVDPTKQSFARASGVPSKYLAEFNTFIAPMVIALNRNVDQREVASLSLNNGSKT